MEGATVTTTDAPLDVEEEEVISGSTYMEDGEEVMGQARGGSVNISHSARAL